MSKAETWRNAARQQNEADLLRQADRMDLLARAAETLAVSMARLSEETKESMDELGKLAAAGKETLTQNADVLKSAMKNTNTLLAEIRKTISDWSEELRRTRTEFEQGIGRSLRGLTIKLCLAMIGASILAGASSGWLIWRWSSQRREELESAYRAGLKAAIEELSRSYTIRAKTAPAKPSGRSSGPTERSGSTSGSGTRSPTE